MVAVELVLEHLEVVPKLVVGQTVTAVLVLMVDMDMAVISIPPTVTMMEEEEEEDGMVALPGAQQMLLELVVHLTLPACHLLVLLMVVVSVTDTSSSDGENFSGLKIFNFFHS